MANFFKMEETPRETDSNNQSLSIDAICSNLYLFPDKIQFCHHLTTSFAKHSALDKTYESLDSLKDEIIEKLIGYTGTRFKTLTLGSITNYTENYPKQLAQEIMQFGKKLEEWGEEMGYCDISNLAAGYSGAGAKLNYLLSLS